MMTKGELRAAEYRARADEALASVETAKLDHVREQRRHSAAVWTSMAQAEEARTQSLRGPPPRRAPDTGPPAVRTHPGPCQDRPGSAGVAAFRPRNEEMESSRFARCDSLASTRPG